MCQNMKEPLVLVKSINKQKSVSFAVASKRERDVFKEKEKHKEKLEQEKLSRKKVTEVEK